MYIASRSVVSSSVQSNLSTLEIGQSVVLSDLHPQGLDMWAGDHNSRAQMTAIVLTICDASASVGRK
jgi:hypothetical protein